MYFMCCHFCQVSANKNLKSKQFYTIRTQHGPEKLSTSSAEVGNDETIGGNFKSVNFEKTSQYSKAIHFCSRFLHHWQLQLMSKNSNSVVEDISASLSL